uniref:Protein kinase domain-containing protein n=1 Tax=Anopheles farauti TaxID=69004 RepID=A0A182QNS4_9DIPT
MIHVDETDPLGDIPPAFPYREVEIKRGIDPKQIYELSSELGRGKFGVVYKCKEKSTGVRLAAKFIQIVKKGDRRNIEREVHMMNVLHHSKIAQLYAAYEFDRTFCVMMELVEGGELFDRVLDEKFVLTEKACAIFMRQICDAVAYIHGNNIIHLDMKPENILCLTEAGNRIKIIDFGLAREYDPDNKLQVLFGTPEFVAPEVVNFEAISFATDMWSVGVIAYVLVSGLSPFAGEDDIQTMGNITIGRYDFLDEAFDNVSEEAIDFINRCLVKEQKERLTAEDALKHKWIKRKPQYHPTNRRPSLTNFKPILLESNNNSSNVTSTEIAKDNLKELVGKWDETPNNRYAFEQDTENIIAPTGETVQLRRPTLPELAGSLPNGAAGTGSRRGSIAREATDAEGSGGDAAPMEEERTSRRRPHDEPRFDRTEPPIVLELTQPTGMDSCAANTAPEEATPTNSDRFDSCQCRVTSGNAGARRNAASGGSVCSSASDGSSISSLAKRVECGSPATNALAPACPAEPIVLVVVDERLTDANEPDTNPYHFADSDSVASSCDTTVSVCTERTGATPPPLPTDAPTSDGGPQPLDPLVTKVRDDLRKLSDLLKLSLTNVKAPEVADADADGGSVCTGSLSPASPMAVSLELDSELASLKSKVSTIRTSRAQNKLNELAQRPDFLANDPFKLPTFRFLPKSISLCNEDSVFKENYTKFCDRNAREKSREKSPAGEPERPVVPVVPVVVVRKKSSTSSAAGSGSSRKKKELDGTVGSTGSSTTTTTTTTFASTATGRIASTTTVRKTIVKQQKVVTEEATESRKTFAPTKSLDDGPPQDGKLTHSASIKRTKFRVNQLSSRDVPVAINSVARRYLERSGVQDDLSTGRLAHPAGIGTGTTTVDDTVTANNLRNSALRLRSSVSVDWDAMEAVENRSMKTINTFLKRHAVASSAVRQIQAQLEASITTHK